MILLLSTKLSKFYLHTIHAHISHIDKDPPPPPPHRKKKQKEAMTTLQFPSFI
jgi:hypothetical protein